MKARKVLLIIGGVFQLLAAGLHVGIAFALEARTVPEAEASIWASMKPTAHIFNAAVLTTVLFFAFVSLLRSSDLIDSGLGRVVCAFVALFYLQRAVVEVIVRGFNPFAFGLLLVIAVPYVICALPNGKGKGR